MNRDQTEYDNTNAGDRGNARVLESRIRLSAFQCRRRGCLPCPPGPSGPDGDDRDPACGCLRECHSGLLPVALRSDGQDRKHHDRCRRFGLTCSDGYVRAPYEVAGRQPRKNPGLRAWREQRVRSCLRHALRLAREHETRPPRTRGRAPSRRRRHRAPSAPGGTRARARNRSERQRLRWRYSGTIRLRQPIASGRRTGRLRRRPRAPDRLLRSARSRSSEESRQPGLVAAVRSALGRLHFVWDSTDVARSPAPHRNRAGTRAATRRRLREKLARRSRHARRYGKERRVAMITTVEVERFSLTSSRPFDKILAAIKAAVGHPDMVEFAKTTAAARTFTQFESTVREGLGKSGLMLFMELDHGSVIRKATGSDKPRMARLIMGNPLIMQQMARHVPDAGSYAPVTVLVDERSDGVHISYDRMVSLLAPYRNSDALAVARDLDKKVETLLSEAAG